MDLPESPIEQEEQGEVSSAAAVSGEGLEDSGAASSSSRLRDVKVEGCGQSGNDAKSDQAAVGTLNGVFEIDGRKRSQRNHEIQVARKIAEAVEDDAHAVARSLTALLSSLKSALSEVTTSSVANMRVENEAAGLVQDAAIDAASKGNRFINACLRLNEEMKGMDRVASQLYPPFSHSRVQGKISHIDILLHLKLPSHLINWFCAADHLQRAREQRKVRKWHH